MNNLFKKASGLFLTEEMSYEEYINCVDSGGRLPVNENYEYWDEFQLEDAIMGVAHLLTLDMAKQIVLNEPNSGSHGEMKLSKEIIQNLDVLILNKKLCKLQ